MHLLLDRANRRKLVEVGRKQADGQVRTGPCMAGEVCQGYTPYGSTARYVATMVALTKWCRGALKYVLRRLEAGGRAGRQGRMKVVESLALGGRRQLFMVVCNGKNYLVGAGADGVGSIIAIPADAELRNAAANGTERVSRDRVSQKRVDPQTKGPARMWTGKKRFETDHASEYETRQ